MALLRAVMKVNGKKFCMKFLIDGSIEVSVRRKDWLKISTWNDDGMTIQEWVEELRDRGWRVTTPDLGKKSTDIN